jgi:hypothetical protein
MENTSTASISRPKGERKQKKMKGVLEREGKRAKLQAHRANVASRNREMTSGMQDEPAEVNKEREDGDAYDCILSKSAAYKGGRVINTPLSFSHNVVCDALIWRVICRYHMTKYVMRVRGLPGFSCPGGAGILNASAPLFAISREEVILMSMEFDKAEVIDMLIRLVEKDMREFKSSYPSRDVYEMIEKKQKAVKNLLEQLKV